jgi:polyhydroxybutyrate depolymerase
MIETTIPSRGLSKRNLSSGGRERSYLLYIPVSYDSQSMTSLVLVFHGGGGNAENAMTMTGFNAEADQHGFLVVYPNGSGRLPDSLLTWNGGTCCGYAQENDVDDVQFVIDILDDLEAQFAPDPKRIYATGMSNGAIMAYRLACELSDRIAAIGPVAGTQNIPDCNPTRPVSVIHFHGDADENVLFEGGFGPRSISQVDFASVPSSIEFWVASDRCPAQPIEETIGEVATHTTYSPCLEGSAVELYTVLGGGHAWPGGVAGWLGGVEPTQDLSATSRMWEFFGSHPKP